VIAMVAARMQWEALPKLNQVTDLFLNGNDLIFPNQLDFSAGYHSLFLA
jgi:hypothetical protein